jgi:hypothetical protein
VGCPGKWGWKWEVTLMGISCLIETQHGHGHAGKGLFSRSMWNPVMRYKHVRVLTLPTILNTELLQGIQFNLFMLW